MQRTKAPKSILVLVPSAEICPEGPRRVIVGRRRRGNEEFVFCSSREGNAFSVTTLISSHPYFQAQCDSFIMESRNISESPWAQPTRVVLLNPFSWGVYQKHNTVLPDALGSSCTSLVPDQAARHTHDKRSRDRALSI